MSIGGGDVPYCLLEGGAALGQKWRKKTNVASFDVALLLYCAGVRLTKMVRRRVTQCDSVEKLWYVLSLFLYLSLATSVALLM